MQSFFLMWYEFMQSIFDTTGANLSTETESFISLVVLVMAVFGVILSVALVYKLVKYIFFAILSMGH